jgi:hypothetical protein
MDTTSHTSKTIEDIDAMHKAGELKISHHAYKQGYISRKVAGIVREYNGRFGQGYVIDAPLHSTTRYFNRTYYLNA